MKPLRSENAASEVVGYLIILGLTLTGISLITLVGVPSIYKMQEMVSVRNVEQAFTILDSRASQVSLGESRMQRSDINLGGGSMIVKPNSSEKSFVLIELKSGSNVTKSIPIEMGKTVYMLGEREIAYEGGGVWSKYPAGSVMLSPPEFHFNGVTLTLPIVNISGNSSIGGKGSASLKIEKVNNDGNTTKIYPNSTLTNPIPDNVTKVNITIYSKYYDAWADYFKSINLVKVYSYPAEKKVTVTLETPPLITNFSYGALASNEIELRNGAEIDSYNSSQGSYTLSRSNRGSIRANAVIKITNSAVVNGSAMSHQSIECGNGNSCGEIKGDAYGSPVYAPPTGNLVVRGTVKPKVDEIRIVDTTAMVDNKIADYKTGSNPSSSCLSGVQNRTIDLGSVSCVMNSGNYYITKIRLDSTNLVFNTAGGAVEIAAEIPGTDYVEFTKANISVTGPHPVRIYLKGGGANAGGTNVAMVVSGGGGTYPKINIYNNTNQTSTLFQVYSSSIYEIQFRQQSEFCGFVYAADKSKISVEQGAQIYGALVGKTFSVTQSQYIHFDEALKDFNTNIPAGTAIMYIYITQHDIKASIN